MHSAGTHILIYSPDTDVYHIGLTKVSEMAGFQIVVQLSKPYDQNVRFVHMNNLLKCLQTDSDLTTIPENVRPQVMQSLYVATGCDYISFFGLGKASFLKSFFQHASFIAGRTDTNISRSIGCITLDYNNDYAYLSFLRLVGCAYFRKHASAFPLQTPEALFHSIPATSSPLEKQSQWLSIIRCAIHRCIECASDTMPSVESLRLHWRRCVWVLSFWNSSTKNNICLHGRPQSNIIIHMCILHILDYS